MRCNGEGRWGVGGHALRGSAGRSSWNVPQGHNHSPPSAAHPLPLGRPPQRSRRAALPCFVALRLPAPCFGPLRGSGALCAWLCRVRAACSGRPLAELFACLHSRSSGAAARAFAAQSRSCPSLGAARPSSIASGIVGYFGLRSAMPRGQAVAVLAEARKGFFMVAPVDSKWRVCGRVRPVKRVNLGLRQRDFFVAA